jgi:hypothetical protein
MWKTLASSGRGSRCWYATISALAGLTAVPAAAQPTKPSICGTTPLAPVCNVPKCTADGWKIWPIPLNSSCQIAGVQGNCDGGKLGPPGQLEPDAIGHCIVTNPAGSLNPQYYVLGVVYAPPGFSGNASQASTVSYGQGSSFSHDTKVTSSFKQGVSVTASVTIPVLSDILPLSASANYGYTTTSSTTDGLTVTKTSTTTILYPGAPVDGIDHDQDEIYLWLNPRVLFAERGNSLLWTLGIDPDTPAKTAMDIQFVKIGQLKGTIPMDTGVAAELAFHNITPAQYPALIAQDPFATGNTTIDPARFALTLQSFPYEKGAPSTQLAATNASISSSGVTSTTENTVGASVTAGNQASAEKLTVAGSWTWTATNAVTDTNTTTETATVVVKGPSPSYTGPSNVLVYYDTIYKTFMFQFINESPTVSGIVRDSKAKVMVHDPVTLTMGGVVYRTITDTQGWYRFFNVPKGTGTIQVHNTNHPVQVGTNPPQVNVALPASATLTK